MASYTITHTCGHTSKAALVGKHDSREHRIANLQAEPCATCQAAASGLTGSTKQIAYATKVQDWVIRQIELTYASTLTVEALAKAFVAEGVVEASALRAAFGRVFAGRDDLATFGGEVAAAVAAGENSAAAWIAARNDGVEHIAAHHARRILLAKIA